MLKQFREPCSEKKKKVNLFWTRVGEFGVIMHEQIFWNGGENILEMGEGSLLSYQDSVLLHVVDFIFTKSVHWYEDTVHIEKEPAKGPLSTC